MGRLADRLRSLSAPAWLTVSGGALLALLLVQAARYVGTGRLSTRIEQASAALAAAPTRDGARPLEDYQEVVKQGHFGKSKTPPKPRLFGVLGTSALIGTSPDDAKFYDLDAEVPGGAKLVEIAPNSVVLEKDGKKETLTLFPELPAKEEGRRAGKPGRPASEGSAGEHAPGEESASPETKSEPPEESASPETKSEPPQEAEPEAGPSSGARRERAARRALRGRR